MINLDGNELALRLYPNPDLIKRCEEVTEEEFGTFELEILCGRMLAIMRAFEGLGLAANQVGVHKRIFVFENRAVDGIDRPQDVEIPDVIINPVITRNESTTEKYFKEGCLSFPGSFPQIKRMEGFTLDYQDQTGARKTLGPDICVGLFGHAFQHEVDHLDGITMLEKMNSFEKDKAIKKVNKLRRRK